MVPPAFTGYWQGVNRVFLLSLAFVHVQRQSFGLDPFFLKLSETEFCLSSEYRLQHVPSLAKDESDLKVKG